VLNSRRLFGCGVEVGVQQGIFSAHLLANWRGAHLISVDPWIEQAKKEYRDISNVRQETQDLYYRRTLARLARYRQRNSVWRLTSAEASERVPHHSLDFVYVDARHDYESVKEDLHYWADKIRPGGLMSGHDYCNARIPGIGDFGVRQAVDEFFGARDVPVYATRDDEPFFSWLVNMPLPASLSG
jgi:hypothetical protein